MPRPALLARRAVSFALLGLALVPLAACEDDGGAGDTERFCELVQENTAALRADPSTAEEAEDLIDLYNEVGAVAPLAIEPDWSALAFNLETAWTSDDQEEILARMYATEPSALAVTEWLQTNCGVDFGPVATIVPASTTIASSVPPSSPPG